MADLDFDRVRGGAHLRWFWAAVAHGDATTADLGAHAGPAASTAQVSFDSPSKFAATLRDSVFAGASLSAISEVGPEVRCDFRTPSGLALSAVFAFDEDDGRIAGLTFRVEGGASRTALGVAAQRAAHVANDRPVIVDDPLAAQLAGEFATSFIARVKADPFAVAPRFSVAVRARWAEDTLAEAYATGVDQYVILGAGLDSYGYRGELRSKVRVFEVDHPVTQAWKRDRLTAVGVDIPSTVSFVPVDFETDDLDAELERHGFDASRPSVVAWLGVVFYLTTAAISSTLDRIARWAPGTRLLFDYPLPESAWPAGDGWDPAIGRSGPAAAAASGEPWLTSLTPQAVEELLHAAGFVGVEHLDHRAARDRYLPGMPPGPPGPLPFSQCVRAEVGHAAAI